MKLCSVDGCNRKTIARELCTLHYQRAKKESTLCNWAKIKVPDTCTVAGCSGSHEAKGLCTKHYQRFKHYGDCQRGRLPSKGSLRTDGYIDVRRPNQARTKLHIIVAEQALGKKLPHGAVVHHVDENKSNNALTNLVICPDRAYHNLLHQRMRAMAACGEPSWHICTYCKKHDIPTAMVQTNSQWYHRVCRNEYKRSMYASKHVKLSVSVSM